ncbi:glycosyl transferase family 2 [Bacillus sp. AFS073361]|uniref:glycosyltransferase family 2 protein n=1 Tax=Bacillus sp. AFS073361 TaxID=2033511 RepID=UPI000BF3D63C|nr:glycosyltransferase family 2 protein [Bacillus sp. AFS073361]PFP30852.1 glycosyl transferase family 2 [Bacillus sp. AFS073361]
MEEVIILLSTYNGERYLPEQLDSLLNQSYKNWKCIIRDDGSSDNTLKIIESYIVKYPNYFSLVNDGENLGACESFIKLFSVSEGSYFMFCDQDDVWKTNKIKKTILKMKELESKFSSDIPLLVHSDLEIVNDSLQTIAPSMFHYQKLNSSSKKLNQLLVQNNITGCTMMINSAFKNYIRNSNVNEIIMHDWWFGLIAAAFGQIGFVSDSLILYRQHGANVVGAKKIDLVGSIKGFKMFVKKENKFVSISHTFKQANCFYNLYETVLGGKQRNILTSYINFSTFNFVEKLRIMNKYRFKKNYWVKNFVFQYLMLTMKS